MKKIPTVREKVFFLQERLVPYHKMKGDWLLEEKNEGKNKFSICMLIMGFHQLSCLRGNSFFVNRLNNEVNELVMIKLGFGSRVKNQLFVR